MTRDTYRGVDTSRADIIVIPLSSVQSSICIHCPEFVLPEALTLFAKLKTVISRIPYRRYIYMFNPNNRNVALQRNIISFI